MASQPQWVKRDFSPVEDAATSRRIVRRPRVARYPAAFLLGVAFPAALIMATTLAAAVKPHLQGLLLTCQAMGFFVPALVLMPKRAGRADRDDASRDPELPARLDAAPQC